MRFLLIEASTERAMVAISQDKQILFHAPFPFGYHNSRHLLPEIERGMKEQKLVLSDFDAIAVGIGPGSYTGMRVGAMTAKALSFATSLPLIGICTLHTFVSSRTGSYAVLIDAKMGGAYLVDKPGGTPQIVPLDQLGGLLASVSTLVTPSATHLKAKMDALYPNQVWEWEESAPNPSHMASIAEAKFKQGAYTQDGHLDLLYLKHWTN